MAALISMALLTGCVTWLYEREQPLLRPEIPVEQVPIYRPTQPVKDIPPGQTNGDKPLAVKIAAVTPSTLPVKPIPVPSPSIPEPSGTPRTAHADGAGRLAAGGLPDLTYRDAMLTEDMTWHGEVLIEGALTVAPQSTLTIEQGTIIRFGGRGEKSVSDGTLLLYGRIVAKGSPGKPILFTSRFARPTAGDWQGITMLGSEKKNILENCRIEGAETGLDSSFSTVTLKNVQFSRCGTGARMRDSLLLTTGGGANACITGLHLLDSEVEVRDGEFTGNRQGVVAERGSLYIAGGTFNRNDLDAVKTSESRVRLAGGSYGVNGTALTLVLSQGSISGAKINGNAGYGISLSGSRMKVFGNEIARNGGAGIVVGDGKGVAWNNSIVDNGDYDLVNTGTEEFKAMGNWWGNADIFVIDKRIHDTRNETGRGRVIVAPVLTAPPRISP